MSSSGGQCRARQTASTAFLSWILRPVTMIDGSCADGGEAAPADNKSAVKAAMSMAPTPWLPLPPTKANYPLAAGRCKAERSRDPRIRRARLCWRKGRRGLVVRCFLPASDLVAAVAETTGHHALDRDFFLVTLDLRHADRPADDGDRHQDERGARHRHAAVESGAGCRGHPHRADSTSRGRASAAGSEASVGVELACDIELLAIGISGVELHLVSRCDAECRSEFARPRRAAIKKECGAHADHDKFTHIVPPPGECSVTKLAKSSI